MEAVDEDSNMKALRKTHCPDLSTVSNLVLLDM